MAKLTDCKRPLTDPGLGFLVRNSRRERKNDLQKNCLEDCLSGRMPQGCIECAIEGRKYLHICVLATVAVLQ